MQLNITADTITALAHILEHDRRPPGEILADAVNHGIRRLALPGGCQPDRNAPTVHVSLDDDIGEFERWLIHQHALNTDAGTLGWCATVGLHTLTAARRRTERDPWFHTLLELWAAFPDGRPFTARQAAQGVADGRVRIHPDIAAQINDRDLATGLGRRFAKVDGDRFYAGGDTSAWLAVRRHGHHTGGGLGAAHSVLWAVHAGHDHDHEDY